MKLGKPGWGWRCKASYLRGNVTEDPPESPINY